MTRNLGTASSSSCQYKTHIGEHRIKCNELEDLSNLQTSLHRYRLAVTTSSNEHSVLCKPVSVTSSLLCSETEGSEIGKHKHNYRIRRERVCRSWTSGYGTLVEDKESEFHRDRVVLLADTQQQQQQQLARQKACPSALRSTLRRATSLVIATPWKHQTHTADAVPDAAKASQRRSRIDLLLMPSLKSLVSRRSSSSRAPGISGGRDRALLVPGMGGSSSSTVLAAGSGCSAGKSVGDVSAVGEGASLMVPLMKKEASCSSLAPSIRINGSDFRGSGMISDVPSGEQGASGGGNMRKCETMLTLSSFGAALQRSASSSRTTIHVEPLRPVNRLRVLPHYSSSGLSPNVGGGSVSRMCSRCSSLLSMASSSRYSLNTAGGGFVPCSPGGNQPDQNLLCKLCLGDVPSSMAYEINQCGCTFCKDVSKVCQTANTIIFT